MVIAPVLLLPSPTILVRVFDFIGLPSLLLGLEESSFDNSSFLTLAVLIVDPDFFEVAILDFRANDFENRDV